ncbi:LuxR family transcriptional regulator [Sphingomonas crocodyli]|uniref:LuxR family transcriptional regulator n=2 Tax=Sphingomonas crocodyli TaxID=1979270 RepID=A0A437LYZ2_9SPHN|nr:LuxR family transcriptional regulator [Sphingomonas crocodyli]
MKLVDSFVSQLTGRLDEANLHEALERATHDMSFHHFALSRHLDRSRALAPDIRSHNYPAGWVDEYDERTLGSIDPVRRASERTVAGFAWSNLGDLIALSETDRMTLERGHRHGIGDGMTVPANIPGEVSGSCTFALRPGEVFPCHQFGTAQLIGTFAFEAARRLQNDRRAPPTHALTERQRDCVLWVARGKSDWEVSKILGIRHDTVVQHLKMARERYDVEKRTSLVVRALFDGLFSFADIIRRRF